MPNITILTSDTPDLHKTYGKSGQTAAGKLSSGWYQQWDTDINGLSAWLQNVRADQCLCLGSPAAVSGRICTADEYNGELDPIPRTSGFFKFQTNESAWMLIDIDGVDEHAVEILYTQLPSLRECGHIIKPSSNPNPDTHSWHIYIPVIDGSDIPTFMKRLSKYLWLAGQGRVVISKSGNQLLRSIIDDSVGSPERIIYEAQPVLLDGITAPDREFGVYHGELFDTRCLPELTLELDELYQTIVNSELKRTAGEAADVRRSYHATTGISEHVQDGELSADDILYINRNTPLRVGDITPSHNNTTVCDPLEPEYNGWHSTVAKLWVDDNGDVTVRSNAHGLNRIYRYHGLMLQSAGFGVGDTAVVPSVTASVVSPVDEIMSKLQELPFNGTLIQPDQWFPVVHEAELLPINLKKILNQIGDDGRFEGSKRVVNKEYKTRVDALNVQKTGDLLRYMQKRFVYMRNGNRIVDLEKPPYAALMQVSEFKLAFKKKGNVFLNGSDKPTLAVNAYFMNEDYDSVIDERFHPSKPVIYNDDDHLPWFNPAYFPSFPYTEDESLLGDIKEHLIYLNPGDNQYTRFMDWMAWTVCEPQTRIKFTPLLISRHHGTGRTWLTELIPVLLGHHNCTITEMKILAGQGNDGAYHNYFYNSVFCAIQEVKVPGEDAFAVDDAIRSKLTDERMNLNLKYGTNGTYQVFVNFLLLTNHRDALTLTEDDRRIEVFEHFEKPRPDEFYDKIYKSLECHETMSQMYWFLRRWYESRQGIFNPLKPAKMNNAKRRLIGTGTNDLGNALNVVVENYKSDVITVGVLKSHIRDYLMDVNGDDLTTANEIITSGEKHIAYFCKKTFVRINQGKKMKTDGKSVFVYAVKNEQEWVSRSPAEIREELATSSLRRTFDSSVC